MLGASLDDHMEVLTNGIIPKNIIFKQWLCLKKSFKFLLNLIDWGRLGVITEFNRK